jgi:DNA topoisomerase-1
VKYPDCKGIINIPKKGETFIPLEDMPQCPALGCEGRLTTRKSRFGKTFFSCSSFPDCDVIVNDLTQLPEKYQNYERKAYEKKTKKKAGAKGKKSTAKKTRKKPAKPRNMPPVDLTPELAAIVGEKEMPRTQVTKKVWEYIKAHKLQDEKDKRVIVPDEKLAKVFGNNEPMQMFQMTKVLSQHMTKQEKKDATEDS